MASNNNRLTRTQRSFINDKTNAPLQYRNAALLATPQKIVDTQSQGLCIYGYNFVNPNAVAVFVKLYDKASAPTVGTDVPMSTLQVAANGSVVLKGSDVIYYSVNDCWIAVVTGAVDTNNTAPAAGIIVEVVYPPLNVI